MRAGLAEGADLTLPRFLQVMQQRGGKSLGAIRVSLGFASNFADVDRFLQFAAGFPRPHDRRARRADRRRSQLPRDPRRQLAIEEKTRRSQRAAKLIFSRFLVLRALGRPHCV